MIDIIKTSPLFQGISEIQIKTCIHDSILQIHQIKKNEPIFFEGDHPKAVYMLLQGNIAVYNDSFDGKRNLMTTIQSPGDLFGEVYIFLNEGYHYNASATMTSKILVIPKEFFFQSDETGSIKKEVLVQNMLEILSKKAFYLSQKLSIVSSGSLRQKIVRYLLEQKRREHTITLEMNRNELSQYLGVSRPSLSRELSHMEKIGLIQIDKKEIKILDVKNIQTFL